MNITTYIITLKNLSLLSLIYFKCSLQGAYSQNTFTQIYHILNSATCGNNFSSCHNSSAPSGLNFNQTEVQVYSALYNQTPHNTTAAARNDKLIYPGHPYRSFLFRKINNGLAFNIDLENGEGDNMPDNAPPLDNKQIELLRQWIIYGAPQTGEVADTALIAQFYNQSGIESVPNPPQPPNQNEGFQLHLGPYFLPPGGENLGPTGSPFNRFDVALNDSVEINRIECFVGTGFHHLGFFNYPDTNLNTILPYGIVPGQSIFPILNFNLLENMATFQHSDNMNLPYGTAYKFAYKTPLFIADHYQNYSPTNVLSCDVYLNVYYQPENTAIQLMKHQSHNYSDNISNPPIMLPPDGLIHTFSENIYDTINPETRYIWAIMAHSHNFTLTHNIFLRNANGSASEKIYDGGCADGIPGCASPLFQPQDIPTRYISDFIKINTGEGFFREATYRNNSADTVFSGMLANTEEMMAMAYYYIHDTTGIGDPPNSISENTAKDNFDVLVYPNPFNEKIVIDWSKLNTSSPVTLNVYDITGILCYKLAGIYSKNITISKNTLPSTGIYLFTVKTVESTFSGKFILN